MNEQEMGFQQFTLILAANVAINATPIKCRACGAEGPAAFMVLVKDQDGAMQTWLFCNADDCERCVACMVSRAGQAYRDTGMATFLCNGPAIWTPADGTTPPAELDPDAVIREALRHLGMDEGPNEEA